MLDKLHEILGPEITTAAIAGLAGAVVRIATLREKSWQAVGSLAVGGIMAIYAGPLALPLIESVVGALNINETSAAPLSGFLMGLGGISIAQMLLRIWERVGTKGGDK